MQGSGQERIIRLQNRTPERRKFVVPFKPSLIFEVTNRCNCRCSFCYEKTRRENQDVSPDRFARVLKAFRPLYLQITGGEAMLHPKFEDCLAYAARTVPVVQISTNGTVLDKKLKFLGSLKRKPMIGISLDFPDERHDRVRKKKGLFKKIQGVLPLMKEQRVPVALSTTVFGPGSVPEAPEGNLEEVRALTEFSAQWDIPINVQSCSPAVKEVRVELGKTLLASKYRKLVNSQAYRELLVKGHNGRCRYNWTNVSIGADGNKLPTDFGNCYFCGDCLLCFYSCVWEPTLLTSHQMLRQAAHFLRMEMHMVPWLDRLLASGKKSP